MNLNRKVASVLLTAAAVVLAGCSPGRSGSGTISGTTTAVALQGSQQGQSGGLVDYDGDGIDDLAVGAPYAKAGSAVGAVLVYKGSANGFDSKPTWVLTGDDNFGFAFTNLGDVDGDDTADFAVGAYNGNGADVSLSGSVTIYKGGSGGKVIATLAGEAPLDKFGFAIAAGDFSGNGKRELVVGAPFNSPSPALYQKGAVYVYPIPFSDTTRITLPATAANGGLGSTIAAGDVNGDGIDDLLIGAAGKVLVYYGRPDFNPATIPPDVVISSADGGFGSALAVLSDLDGDGFKEIIIGAPKATVNGNAEQGRLYIVKGGSGPRTINLATATADLLTKIDGAAFFDRFGFAVVPVGAIPEDGGKPNFAVTAIHADRDGATSITTGLASGKVYLFQGKDLTIGGDTLITKASVFNGPAYNMSYGTFLSPFAKNGPKLLIGSPTVNRQTGGAYAVNLENGSPSTPLFQAAGSDNSTTGDSCCGLVMSKGGNRP